VVVVLVLYGSSDYDAGAFEFFYYFTSMNKDLVLREYLAIERTKLANETTLLAYIRTGLYFLVAGSTLGQLIQTSFWDLAGPPLMGIGLLIIAAGVYRFRKVKRAIELGRRNVGNSTEAFIKLVRNENDD
jgi:putative membrane protein